MRLLTRQGVAVFSMVTVLAGVALSVGASGSNLEAQHSGNRMVWTADGSYQSATLTIAVPNGTVVERTFAADEGISFSPFDIEGMSVVDGIYTWQIVLAPVLDSKTREVLESAREMDSRGAANALRERGILPAEDELIHSGSFRFANSALVTDGAPEPEAAQVKSSSTPIDLDGQTETQVISQDLVVQGSECVGLDCVNGESFGFDTLRLKENNLRIHFMDTSNSASFPTADWRIIANDSSNGGGNYLAIEDSTAGRQVFRVNAGAPANALFVSSSGDVGIGTSTPVVEVQAVDGNTPTIRLEQNGSSGFTPQTWDMAGNETNFFVRDVTNGSKLPFKIKPGAPDNSLFVAADGDIGIGTASPGFVMHAVRSGSNVAYVAERSGGATTFVNATATFGQVGTTTDHPLRFLVNTDIKMTLNADDSLSMGSGATCSAGGDWLNASSRELKEDISGLSSTDAFEVLNGLEPVRFRYKNDTADQKVGFIAEDVPDLVATNDRKALGAMDIVAVLTKVVQEQQSTIDRLEERLESIENGVGE